ncbi:3-keto-5-aminohexanoate cleavage protein [Shimia abyssi]|uniref:Uncharacterized protein (DUF849 family) n=1 Tax=Shimia abyssi TaxID=1662395 RepID=A0A2P8FEF4_9RHOB|nr:3-keto-5-aminohexanoate cleavage protein [Shimia abyssi]PSL20048.1 uncharacterized protein (DUF849 family) [Shimia abyssi]
MCKPLIMVAPNGARRSKADHPALPVTPDEIAETAKACFAAGADALHLHVRDDDGAHSLDSGRYREAMTEVARAVPNMRLQITTEAVGIYSVAQQLTCLNEVAPNWASVSVREIARDPELASRVYATCADMGCEVQHILYDSDDIDLLQRWWADETVPAKQDSVLFVLGRYSAGQVSKPSDLNPFLVALPNAKNWMLCAFGPQEHACLVDGAGRGGNLRVGFENSLVSATGYQHANNAASVAALVTTLKRNKG